MVVRNPKATVVPSRGHFNLTNLFNGDALLGKYQPSSVRCEAFTRRREDTSRGLLGCEGGGSKVNPERRRHDPEHRGLNLHAVPKRCGC